MGRFLFTFKKGYAKFCKTKKQMAKRKLVNGKSHYLMIDLASLFFRIFDECPVLSKNSSAIENRAMMFFQAQKISKMPKRELGMYFQNVSESTVSRSIKRHHIFMKESPFYNHRFGVFTEEFNKRKKESIRGH